MKRQATPDRSWVERYTYEEALDLAEKHKGKKYQPKKKEEKTNAS
jgi:hypothetical protein